MTVKNHALVLLCALISVTTSSAARAAGNSPAIAYKLHCMGCHLDDGTGSAMGLIPPIPGIAGHLLKHEKGRLYLVNVPGVANSGLPSAETAALLNYVLMTWSSKDIPKDFVPFTGEEVDDLRRTQVQDISLLRKEIMAGLATQGIDIHYPLERH